MNKTRKLQLAEYISSHTGRLNAKGMMEFSDSKNLGVQVKTINSNGDFVIKFSSNDLWVEPTEWLHNYKTVCQQRYEEARVVYESLFPPENTNRPTSVSEDNPKVLCFDTLTSYLNLEPIEDSHGTRYRYPAREEFFSVIDDKVKKLYPQAKGYTKQLLHYGLLLSEMIVLSASWKAKIML